MLRRHWGMLATAAVFATGPAGAQTAGDTQQIDRLEGQIKDLRPVFTEDLIDDVNKFDAAAIAAKAKSMTI